MKGLCEHCAHVHDSTWASAVHRFDPDRPTMYRASYEQSPTRTSRHHAEADMCAHLAGSSID